MKRESHRAPADRPQAASGADQARAGGGEFAAELELARAAALEAGDILRRHFRERGFEVNSKGHDNPVTTADLEADRALRERLGGAFPEYGWLSEETADDGARLARRRVWIVDPLDGTKEFIKGIPEFVVAIALAEDGVPVLGVTYNPVKREMFWAARGAGCHLDGERVRVTAAAGLARAVVLASRSETARGEWKAYKDQLIVNPIGSVAYKLALVAAGKADATFTRTPKSEWDIASGAALLAEAGGVMTDIHGHPLRFNRRHVRLEGFIAAGPELHAALSKLVMK
ncbi:MAG TPA: 3'(2'),5'-bisphosphate nucleotidase CysQ [Candidatus Binataceae bacterium]|jgi:myo-inositol-1(or 4)-monophosphatase|nr:3'(2'),5'-bisphosphate nucleotidase CysQ [Candidatus Binataceae bacterium]